MLEYWKLRRRRRKLKHFGAQVRLLAHRDDDLLATEQKNKLAELNGEVQSLLKSRDPAAIDAFLGNCQARLAEYCPPPSFQTLREYLDVAAVALVVAFGIRALALQPFQIPTGSMQPTLFGVHYIAEQGKANSYQGKLPEFLDFLLFSTRPARAEIGRGGYLEPGSVKAVTANGIFTDTEFVIGGEHYQLPGEPKKVREYARLDRFGGFRPGEVLADGYLSLGDHLFVDRISHHLFGMNRGDVVVFNTEGIIGAGGRPLVEMSGLYYIKRLVGLPGDTLKIVNNQLWIKPAGDAEFQPATAFSEAFQKIYSNQGGYHGHTNNPVGVIGQYLNVDGTEFEVPPDSYFMMGDNSLFSYDSRGWGVVPRRNIVGKALFVFWPFSRRWGVADSHPPLAVPTGQLDGSTFQPMRQQ